MRWLIMMPALWAVIACTQQNRADLLGGQTLTPPIDSAKSNFRVVYSFRGSPDGSHPEAGPLAVLDGKLYGTTRLGGNSQGTVFEVALDGTERVLHSFPASKDDGKQPRAGVVVVNGALYGTTEYGGSRDNLGTAFELKKDGTERVIYSYDGFNGGNPVAGLIADAGVLYGATFDHGRFYHGTLYALSTAGGFKLLHSFGRVNDGTRPAAAPEFFRGRIYGTTLYGPEDGAGAKGGVVYEINVTGKSYRRVHLFGNKPDDGENPSCRLAALGGSLYGTTERGGKFGKGTIFTIGANGTEAVLHSFDGNDGRHPNAGLTPYDGMLFGQTYDGGANNKGVVFEITPSGNYRVLHEFDGNDGAGGLSELLLWNGKLYGTTNEGGAHNQGTVFEITP